MSTNIWHKLWNFLNQPLFVKPLDLDNIPYCEPVEYPDLSWTEDYLLRETQLTVDSFSYKRQVEYLEHCLWLDVADPKICDR